MPNAWVSNVKFFAVDSNLSYSCALSMPECKTSYKNKNKKESIAVEEKPKEEKAYTMYKKPIGPVKAVTVPEQKEQKAYTMY